ncbi:hypothetical protein LCGC14_2142590, partial [marine sediment metagenome]
LYVIACESGEVNVYKISLTAGGDNGTANAAVTTTNTTLTDTREAWTTDEWIGDVVTCNSKTLTVTGNTANTLTGSSWSAGGNPGDGNSWIMRLGGFGTLLNTKTFATTTTQPMGRPAKFNDGSSTRWYLGLGDNGKIQRLDSVVSASAADSWTASGDADARQLRVVGNRLFRTTDENQVSICPRASDPMTEANWGGDFFVGDVSYNITDIGESAGLCYLTNGRGFWEWDTIGEAENVLPEIGTASRNGQGMLYWHGGFLIPSTNLWWTRTGQPVGPDSNPNNQGHDGTLTRSNYSKFGRWHGTATLGSVFYTLYFSPGTTDKCILFQGRERGSEDVTGWGPIVFHSLRQPAGDNDDFHGVHIAETSEFSATVTRPSLWYANGNNVSYVWLNQDGTPFSEPSLMDVTGAAIISAPINFGLPEEIVKQLRVIECVAENLNAAAPSTGSFQFAVRRSGSATWDDVGGAIVSSGRQALQRFWTQDSNDTAKWMLFRCTYDSGSDPTTTDVPTLRNIVIRGLALPDITRVWTFFLTARDKAAKTGKLVRSELEGYVNDLKKYELPDGDSFNGVLTNLRLLRADEVRELVQANQPPPHYVIRASVREMIPA